jgi:hypothetical protein
MKTNFLLTTIVLLGLVSFAATAQVSLNDDSKIKVLPSATKNVIKVLYASEVDGPVTVTFYDGAQVYGQDVITEKMTKGFIKKYDVGRVNENSFLVRVSSHKLAAIYKVTRVNGGKSFNSQLKSMSTDPQLLVKRNN